MNAQRDVIYKRRRHALFGDRLQNDLDNALFDVCTDLANQFENNRDYEAFRLEVMKHLAIEPEIPKEGFDKINMAEAGDKLYHQAKEFDNRNWTAMREQMLPTLSQILEQNGDRVENIVIPFTDGIRGIQVYANLKQSVEQEGRPIIQNLEKSMT